MAIVILSQERRSDIWLIVMFITSSFHLASLFLLPDDCLSLHCSPRLANEWNHMMSYPYGCTYVFSYRISDGNLCRSARRNTVWCRNELISGSTVLMNVWSTCRMFYIENSVLACEWFDVERATTNDRNSSDINHMNKVLNPRSAYVERELRGHGQWRSTCHNRYTWTYRFPLPHLHLCHRRRLLLLHHHPCAFPKRHWLTRKDSARTTKTNSSNTEHLTDISIDQLESNWRCSDTMTAVN